VFTISLVEMLKTVYFGQTGYVLWSLLCSVLKRCKFQTVLLDLVPELHIMREISRNSRRMAAAASWEGKMVAHCN
jgi:hypothetical protein